MATPEIRMTKPSEVGESIDSEVSFGLPGLFRHEQFPVPRVGVFFGRVGRPGLAGEVSPLVLGFRGRIAVVVRRWSKLPHDLSCRCPRRVDHRLATGAGGQCRGDHQQHEHPDPGRCDGGGDGVKKSSSHLFLAGSPSAPPVGGGILLKLG